MQLNLFDRKPEKKPPQPVPELPADAQYLLTGFARISTGRRSRRRRKSPRSTRPMTWTTDTTPPATPPPSVEMHRGNRRDEAPSNTGEEANQGELLLYYSYMTHDGSIQRPVEDEVIAAMYPPATEELELAYTESLTYPQ